MLKKIYLYFCRLPYALGISRTLEHNPASVHFWAKQTYHFGGGLAVGLVLGPLGFVVLLPLGYAEYLDCQGGQSWYKAVIDLAFWAGGISVAWLVR